MRSRTELALKIEVTDWSTVAKLFNWSSGVQISCNIFSLLKSCLYSVKCSWIKKGEFASVLCTEEIYICSQQENVIWPLGFGKKWENNNSFLEIGSILCSAKSTLDAIPGRLWQIVPEKKAYYAFSSAYFFQKLCQNYATF